MTTTYLTISEVAQRLDKSINTVKEWDKHALLPTHDATFGTTTTIRTRAWEEERLLRLLIDPVDDNPADWVLNDIPHYLNSAGVAELIGRSENTVKWWAKVGALPQPDGISGHTRGWREDTIRDWVASQSV